MPGRRSTRRRAVLPALVAGLVLGLVAGCGPDDQETPKENAVDLADRPSMEQVLEEYEQMTDEVFTALDAELGPRPWGTAPNNPGQVRSRCAEDPDGESLALDLHAFEGSYPRSDWDRAVEVVQEVGRRHGFDETGTVVEREDDLEVYGEDEHGARYVFGMARNTVFSMTTGCHRWRTPPSAAPAPSGIPDHARDD